MAPKPATASGDITHGNDDDDDDDSNEDEEEDDEDVGRGAKEGAGGEESVG